MHHHVTSLYAAWLDQTPEERRGVEEHLRRCPACAAYYRKMSLLLDEAGQDTPRLAADPFLPARIAARAHGPSVPTARRAARTALRWSAAGALAVLAVVIGISLGKDLAPSATAYTSSDIVSAYYGAVSQQNFSTRLETVVESTPKGTP
jgi:anti-sigma factor RsiW